MMDADRFSQISERFEAARSLPPDRRARYLADACKGDPDLRREVEELLAEHTRQSPLDTSTPGQLADLITRRPPGHETGTPTRIDRYTIVEHIGEGGMGSVYEARQQNPDRAVALKVIKRGMDSRQVIARFETERRALAMMDHPNIAQVFDAGTTEDGRPYFAMELVRGVSIIEYCQTKEPDITAKLGLFVQVCRAVQHAHQKGIIHRDLKPSNVLVTEVDGVPVPKVIDFGIAKATGTEPDARTAITMHGQLVGTPAYMSPEQTTLNGQHVDTRTDIYSLGVLLYELLTGTTPFPDEALLSKGLAEMMRVINNDEPQKPSTRLLTLEKQGTTTSIARASITRTHGPMLAGDLDWITMKCLEKDPSRRYDSVSALSDDLGRFLHNEPVLARPASRAYLIRKFVRRHRAQVIAASALLAVLVLGIAGSSAGMIWALDERENARRAARDELVAQVRATESAQRATSEAQAAEDLSRFFIMDVLSAADPSRTTNHELTVREALVNASENIEGRFKDRPDVESRIHNALGYLFDQLGAPELALHHHMREWELAEETDGAFSIESARMMHSVVASLAMQGRNDEAIELTQRELRIIDNLATPEAEQLRPRAVGNLGALLVRTGRLTEAIPILEDTLKVKRAKYGDHHLTTLSTINDLGMVLSKSGSTQRALGLAQEAYDGRTEVLGEGDPRTITSLLNLANAHTRLGQPDEALTLLREGADRAKQRLGPEHPLTQNLRNTCAKTLLDSDHPQEAVQEARAIINDLDPSDQAASLSKGLVARSIVSTGLSAQGRNDEAIAFMSQTLEAARAAYPPSSKDLAQYLGIYASALIRGSRFQEAEHALTEAWGILAGPGAAGASVRAYIHDRMIDLYTSWNTQDPSPGRAAMLEAWKNK